MQFNAKSTQCNFYLLNRPKLKEKGINCNLKESGENKTVTQRKILGKLNTSDLRNKLLNLNGDSRVSSVVIKENKSTQCGLDVNLNKYLKTSGTQTSDREETKSDAASQCDESNISERFQGTCIEKATYILQSTDEFSDLQYQLSTSSDTGMLTITRNGIKDPVHHVEPIHVTLDQNGICKVHILFKPVETCNLQLDGLFDIDRLCDILRKLSDEDYVFCSGIPSRRILQNVNSVETHGHPFLRHQSRNCEVWYKEPYVVRNKDNVSCPDVKHQCLRCKYTSQYLTRVKRRRSSMTPSKNIQRTQVNSNYSLHRLTPKSKRRRLIRTKEVRRALNKKIDKLEQQLKAKDVLLNAKQSVELQKVMAEINANHTQELNNIIEEHKEDQREILKESWERDSKQRHVQDTTEFFKDQARNTSGDRGNTWSPITYRMALAVYSRSKAAYSALKSFNILQLPSIKSLQNKSGKFLDPPGVNHKYLEDQAKKYKEFQDEKRKKGEKVPANTGALIFDEVKIIDKVIWNSKNHEFVGLAMTPDEFPQLYDVIRNASASGDEPSGAKYMVQFLWRDMTSNFDLIGPYFSCESSLDHRFMMGCVLETLRSLQSYKFNTICLVCDGASENLALIKTTLGHKGVFGYKENHDGTSDFSITPSFENPWQPGQKIHWIICPSHQLKNMISALHSSRPGGTKCFNLNDAPFGWEQIVKMKAREEERFDNAQLRYEPKLLQSYIERDAWTRLNVKPSKIFQQENILSELFDHAHSNAEDASATLNCYNYLRACNRIFENGFLSKKCVSSINSSEMNSILSGYQYFEQWMSDLLNSAENFQPNAPKQTRFLAWQTWDLLRVCVFGVKSLIEDFTTRHPGYFLVLSRINGSAVESLFSQFKYATGSKLSSVNYSTARKAVLVKANVHGSNSSNTDYRDVPLYIRESDI